MSDNVRFVHVDHPTLCRFCGAEGGDPELQEYEDGDACKIYELNFECGSVFQYTMCQGHVVGYYFEQICGSRDVH